MDTRAALFIQAGTRGMLPCLSRVSMFRESPVGYKTLVSIANWVSAVVPLRDVETVAGCVLRDFVSLEGSPAGTRDSQVTERYSTDTLVSEQ